MTAPVTPPAVWNIGRYRAADGVHPWPMAADEWMADCAGVGRVLARLGVERGRRVLIASILSEANTVWPLIVATMGAGAQHSCAEATATDAFRTRMFLRTLEYRAVLGVTDAMLAEDDELVELLRAVPVVAARPGAFERLTEAGLTPHRWLDVGPVLALEDAPGAGACFDPERWTVTSVGGELVVSSPVPRLTPFDGLRTKVRGEVHDGRIFVD
jgi:hypothetical protein